MRESDLLSHIYGRSAGLAREFPYILAGPGHDCAVIALPKGDSILLKVDQLVEGTHFRGPAGSATPLDLIARKSIARAISDIAAAGGRPVAALAAATLPPECIYADDLFDAMSKWARHWGCPLVGGDIASWKAEAAGAQRLEGGLVLSVSVIGLPHEHRGPVLRSGARAGDSLYVTGALGGSLDPATGLGRHLTFEPRLQEARWLCDTFGDQLRAMMDVSDGLGRDAGRLAKASGVRIEIEAAAIPRHAEAPDWRRAASDGEDHELLFALGPGAAPPASCPATGTPIIRIGMLIAGSGCFIRDGSTLIDASGLGWDHR
ncbi:MAG: thiamine-monophosphate kinase [Phycisphaerales bacterium]|nr:thiamine-monophosphate kinase [Phycisphaerales bacterium]